MQKLYETFYFENSKSLSDVALKLKAAWGG